MIPAQPKTNTNTKRFAIHHHKRSLSPELSAAFSCVVGKSVLCPLGFVHKDQRGKRMAKPRRKSRIPDKNPEFFKVYLPQLSSQRMSIPPAFINEFNGTIPKKAILKDLSGRLWHVELEEVGKSLFIQNGWQGFVSDNSLEHGDFLVFTYNQNSIFDVRLFGKNGCKKEDAVAINKAVIQVKKEEDPEAQHTFRRFISDYKQKVSETNLQRIGQSSGLPEVSQHKSRRIAATNVEETNFVIPKNPHFITFISRSNRYNVNIPRTVVNKNSIKINPDMKLRDPRGRLWPVTVAFRHDGRIAITNGWINFRKEYKLGMQDKCVFEFVLRGRISSEMRVQIFRATRKYGRPGIKGQMP